jgi:carboxyl-terminal processing protease
VSYREADLAGHLENASPEDGEEAAVLAAETQPHEPPEVIVRDYQLNEAINVLKGLNIVRPKVMARSQTELLQDIEGTAAH